MQPVTLMVSSVFSGFLRLLPGLLVCAGGTALALWVNSVTGFSVSATALFVGVLFGNLRSGAVSTQVGLNFASKPLLRLAIVLLGFRLSLTEIRAEVGLWDVLALLVLVSATVWGIGKLCTKCGLSADFGRLLGVGYAVCGVSAIAAVKPLTTAEEEEVAYAVGLVTFFGTLSMLSYPVLGALSDMAPELFGWWVGAATHDVAQVVATAAIRGDEALETAVVVKLGRVALLGPILVTLTFVTLGRKSVGRPGVAKVFPSFVVGFLLAVGIRSFDVMSADLLAQIDNVRKVLLAVAMVGVGALVNVRSLTAMGGKPLKVGFVSWFLLAIAALLAARLVTLL